MNDDLKDKRIILIEDDDLIRELYKNHLTAAGFKIDAFANGKDGLAAINQQNSSADKKQYDLLLLDVLLPDSNGLEILKEVKSNPETKKTIVVMLTNLGQDTVIDEAYQAGASGYLIKLAYNPDQIIEEIKRFLSEQS
jgi:DNA-binding response OmpR family regulator